MLDTITPLILTRDEEPNIARTLGQLAWAKEVVVVDSFSVDRTAEIARTFPNARVVAREFDTHAAQWQFGLDQIASEWVLALDADFFVTDELVQELSSLIPPADVDAYVTWFIYAVNGKRLRASLYPPRITLARRDRASFIQDGHSQRLLVPGRVATLRGRIVHDDRKSFDRFVGRQRAYMRLEAAKLRATPFAMLSAAGRVRKLRIVAPFAALAYTLLVKRTILDGRAGFRYAWERFVAEAILSRELFRA